MDEKELILDSRQYHLKTGERISIQEVSHNSVMDALIGISYDPHKKGRLLTIEEALEFSEDLRKTAEFLRYRKAIEMGFRMCEARIKLDKIISVVVCKISWNKRIN